eukprot:6192783-Pleurochrysis_carterae.AAC.3
MGIARAPRTTTTEMVGERKSLGRFAALATGPARRVWRVREQETEGLDNRAHTKVKTRVDR